MLVLGLYIIWWAKVTKNKESEYKMMFFLTEIIVIHVIVRERSMNNEYNKKKLFTQCSQEAPALNTQ